MIPRLFAFDLDGTLLDSTKKLSNANLEALREIQESGAVIVFASGRLGAACAGIAVKIWKSPC